MEKFMGWRIDRLLGMRRLWVRAGLGRIDKGSAAAGVRNPPIDFSALLAISP
jgi:hypothetical protein